jgi:general stress protein YciG
MKEKSKGKITVAEAGRKGGLKTLSTHGRIFYEEIGSKGGSAKQQRVRKLTQKGEEAGKE